MSNRPTSRKANTYLFKWEHEAAPVWLKVNQPGMQDVGWYPTCRYFPTHFANASVCLFFPLNCREHQISPVVELTYYYAYSYLDGPLADADRKHNAFENGHIHRKNKKTTADRAFWFYWCLLFLVSFNFVVMIGMTTHTVIFVVLKECFLVPPCMTDAEQSLQKATVLFVLDTWRNLHTTEIYVLHTNIKASSYLGCHVGRNVHFGPVQMTDDASLNQLHSMQLA